jgi:hypothetical protein
VARIVPSDIARLELAGANRYEIGTLRLLQARLPDSYTVFHGVHWTREWPGETVFGELDFVVVNRAGKALLIEWIMRTRWSSALGGAGTGHVRRMDRSQPRARGQRVP